MGCIPGDKGSADLTFIAPAVETGRCTVRPDSPRRTIQEMRELFQRDRFLVVEAPGRVTLTQQCRSRRGSLSIAVREVVPHGVV
jgi:hypothetical protein